MKFRCALMCAAALAAVLVVGCGSKHAAEKSSAGGRPGTAASRKAKPSSQKPPASMPPELEAFLKAAAGKPTGKEPPTAGAGQEPGAQAHAPAAIPPGTRPTAEQLLAAVRMLYGRLETVRCEGVSSTVVKRDGKVAMQIKDTPFSIMFKRPDKFKMSGPDSEMVSDGKTVYIYNPQAKRYIKDKAGEEVLEALVMSKLGIGVMGLLLRADYEKAIDGAKLLSDSKLGGRDMYVLSLDLKAPQGARAVQKLWIGKKDLVIYKNEVVAREKPLRPKGYTGDMPGLVETTLVGTVRKFEPNPKLADSLFRFEPPAGARLAEAPKPVDIMNKPAPDLTFKWIDGSQKKLSDFRGKTVLLDFWALPDCEKQLPILESIHRDLADVQLISVNLNLEAGEVDELMKQKGYTFPVVHADESIGTAAFQRYGLSAVPTMFIIDANGVVRGGMVGIATLDEVKAKLKKSGL